MDITYPLAWGSGVEAKLASLCAEAVDAIKGGSNILIISDRAVCADRVAIPALLALSRHPPTPGARGLAHHRRAWWWKQAQRAKCTTSPCWRATGQRRCTLPGHANAGGYVPFARMVKTAKTPQKAIANYIKAIGKGLSKIMSKMGVSTYASYCGAQLFEAIGLSSQTVAQNTSPARPAASRA